MKRNSNIPYHSCAKAFLIRKIRSNFEAVSIDEQPHRHEFMEFLYIKSGSGKQVTDYNNLSIQTRVNGGIRQVDNTSNLMFPFDYIISYISNFMTLKLGDMIATGRPNGAGARLEPTLYLKPGDVVKVEVAGVGILRNNVENETV